MVRSWVFILPAARITDTCSKNPTFQRRVSRLKAGLEVVSMRYHGYYVGT